jgi:hypothetical protein
MKKQSKKHQNARSIDDLQDFKFQYLNCKHLAQASCTEFTSKLFTLMRETGFLSKKQTYART